jgi:hypothetical protein
MERTEVVKAAMRFTKSARDSGQLATIYKNTPELHESSQFLSKNSHRSQWEARCRKGARGSGESEVFEESHGFEKAVRGSGGQQGIQEEG